MVNNVPNSENVCGNCSGIDWDESSKQWVCGGDTDYPVDPSDRHPCFMEYRRPKNPILQKIFDDLEKHILAAEKKHGPQLERSPEVRLADLMEEVGEVGKEISEAKRDDSGQLILGPNYETELFHTMTVAARSIKVRRMRK